MIFPILLFANKIYFLLGVDKYPIGYMRLIYCGGLRRANIESRSREFVSFVFTQPGTENPECYLKYWIFSHI